MFLNILVHLKTKHGINKNITHTSPFDTFSCPHDVIVFVHTIDYYSIFTPRQGRERVVHVFQCITNLNRFLIALVGSS